jgi:hypothetical protein
MHRTPRPILWFVLLSFLGGCSLTVPPRMAGAPADPPPDPGTCEKHNDRHFWGGTIAAGSALGGGATGFAGIKTEDKTTKTALSITTVVLAILSGASTFASQKSAADWAAAGCGKK